MSLSLLGIPNESGRLSSMEGLRAYAALIVFLYHTTLTLPKHGVTGPIVDWMRHSQYGVDIFFLLSGYLIAGMVAKPQFRYRRFLVHRIARIYPAFLVSLFACAIGLVALRGESISAWMIVSNVLLLNGFRGLDIPEISYVTWSLTFEFAFYLVFPPLYSRFGFLAAAITILAIIIPLGMSIDPMYFRFAFFLAGAWLKLFPESRPRMPESLTIGHYLIITTGTIYLAEANRAFFVLVYAGAAALLVNHALHERGYLQRLFSLPALRTLGNLSYSFYLLHPIGLMLARYAIAPLHLDGIAWGIAFVVAGFVLSVLLAAASFIALERPYFLYRDALWPRSEASIARRAERA